jgi:hypothetical protein
MFVQNAMSPRQGNELSRCKESRLSSQTKEHSASADILDSHTPHLTSKKKLPEWISILNDSGSEKLDEIIEKVFKERQGKTSQHAMQGVSD